MLEDDLIALAERTKEGAARGEAAICAVDPRVVRALALVVKAAKFVGRANECPSTPGLREMRGALAVLDALKEPTP